MGDTETFDKKNDSLYEENGDDFPSMFTDILFKINFKMAFFLFIMMLFVLSDLFIEFTLINFDGALDGDCPTTKGTLIQIIFMVIGYIILDLMIKGGLL